MNRDAIIAILGILRTAYPRFYANLSEEDAMSTINLWEEMFADCDKQLVTVAVKNLINTFEFPPTIADVKNEMYKLSTVDERSDIELWNELKDAIRGGIYYADEIFPRLSLELQTYLHNPKSLKELAMLDMDEIDLVQKGIFLKQIPIIREREKQKAMMLPEARKFLTELVDKMSAEKLLKEGTND